MLLEQCNRKLDGVRGQARATVDISSVPANKNGVVPALSAPVIEVKEGTTPPPKRTRKKKGEPKRVQMPVRKNRSAGGDGIVCGVTLSPAEHAGLKARAEANRTSVKYEALRAIQRDLSKS